MCQHICHPRHTFHIFILNTDVKICFFDYIVTITTDKNLIAEVLLN